MVRNDEMGKLPPQARDMEIAVLSACLTEANAVAEAVEHIKTDACFYVDAHRHIWKAIRELYNNHQPVDLLTVTDQMRKHGTLDAAGGPYFIAKVSSAVASAANVEHHSKVVVEKYIRRRIIEVAGRAATEAYNDMFDTFELLDQVGTEFDTINRDLTSQGNVSFYDSVREAAEQLKRAADLGDHITGVQTFSPALDYQLRGMQPSDLIIVAARPAMGKTSAVLHIAKNQAQHDIPVGIFSLEMSKQQLINKMISDDLGIEINTIVRGEMNMEQWERFDEVTRNISELPMYINDTGGLSINLLCAFAKNWKRKHDIQALYIDYIGLITTHDAGRRFGTKEQEIAYISARLKALAKELQIPVIVLSQLSRRCEERPDKRPMLSDLRDSGAIEQDADIVVFLFRPEYYGLERDEHGAPLPPGLTELIIAKYRNGQIGTVMWLFDKKISRFKDLEDYQTPF